MIDPEAVPKALTTPKAWLKVASIVVILAEAGQRFTILWLTDEIVYTIPSEPAKNKYCSSGGTSSSKQPDRPWEAENAVDNLRLHDRFNNTVVVFEKFLSS